MSNKRKRVSGRDEEADDGIERNVNGARLPFTPGWTKELNSVELLPVKGKDGKIIRKRVERKTVESDVESDVEEEEFPIGNTDEGDDSGVDEEQEGMVWGTVADDGIASEQPTMKIVPEKQIDVNMNEIKLKVAELCLAVTAAPEKALSRREVLNEDGEPYPKLNDLIALLQTPNYQVKEVVMLSVALVFRDICPGYRIRPHEKSESTTQLKKETKQLRDFEKSLLLSYQQFLKYLDKVVVDGLGRPHVSKMLWNVRSKFALSALRCQCELLRTMSHFNFRNILIESIVNRAAQPEENIAELCCSSLRNQFVNDKSGELSYEIVTVFSKVISNMKHSPLEMFIDCLKSLNLRVHANDMKLLHRKAKQARRKRKRAAEAGDDVDAEILEGNATTEALTVKRFQADTLQEVSLIYFRIIKKKMGFSLVPAALLGLSAITHLINIDMVEDLIAMLKGLIEATPPPPFIIRLNSLLCAFKTLAGPGQELQADETVFLRGLEALLLDPESIEDFQQWDLILECVDIGIVQKRLEQHGVVSSVVRLLLIHAMSVDVDVCLTILAVVHAVLLRYPRVRSSLVALSISAPSMEEDVVQDIAMQGLVVNESRSGLNKSYEADSVDSSWCLNLLSRSMDPRVPAMIAKITSINIVPIPFKMLDARLANSDRLFARIERSFLNLKNNSSVQNSNDPQRYESKVLKNKAKKARQIEKRQKNRGKAQDI